MFKSNSDAVHNNMTAAEGKFDLQLFNDESANNAEQTTADTTADSATTSEASQDASNAADQDKDANAESAAQKDAQTTEQAETKTAPGAPESYEDFKLPEGFLIEAESTAAVKEWAKANNLTQEAAQSMVDMYCAKIAPTMAKAQETAWQKQVGDWRKESEKTHGKAGIDEANKALRQFADPEYLKWLQDTGMDSHPQEIAMWRKVASQISESRFVDGGNKPKADAKPWDKAYSSMD